MRTSSECRAVRHRHAELIASGEQLEPGIVFHARQAAYYYSTLSKLGLVRGCSYTLAGARARLAAVRVTPSERKAMQKPQRTADEMAECRAQAADLALRRVMIPSEIVWRLKEGSRKCIWRVTKFVAGYGHCVFQAHTFEEAKAILEEMKRANGDEDDAEDAEEAEDAEDAEDEEGGEVQARVLECDEDAAANATNDAEDAAANDAAAKDANNADYDVPSPLNIRGLRVSTDIEVPSTFSVVAFEFLCQIMNRNDWKWNDAVTGKTFFVHFIDRGTRVARYSVAAVPD